MSIVLALIAFTAIGSISAYTHHPQYINCQLPGAENTTVIFANETWQQCKGQKLEIIFCIADTDSGYNCVKHARVKQTIDETTGFKWYFAKAYYLDGSDRHFIDCGKLRRERPEKLTGSAYKLRCLNDLSETPKQLENPQNELCHMKFHKALYINEANVYSCNNGKFQLSSCMITVNDQYKCVPKGKFSSIQWNAKDFCKNFKANPANYLPDYRSQLIDCNSGL